MTTERTCPFCGKITEITKYIPFCSETCYNSWYENYNDNPFVRIVGAGKLAFSGRFVSAAQPFYGMGIDSILKIFEIEKKYVFQRRINDIQVQLAQERVCICRYDEVDKDLFENPKALRILAKRLSVMEKMVDDTLIEIGQVTRKMEAWRKRELCLTLSQFPQDPYMYFTNTYICRAINIPRSSYWKYINDPEYGLTISERDARYVDVVRQAFYYKGYPKGARMVYMLIPRLSGQKIGLDRIRRIMRQYYMDCGIRERNSNRATARGTMKLRRCPNILRRMFRLHRPNEVRLTDVTYIQCNKDFRAFGSALMDPVTGVLVAFVVSENNDLDLAMETLRQADKHPCENGGIFHSDQGTLYLSPKFQAEVERLGFVQSMSKRGNCWDNSPQESFFGHFKDECQDKYTQCKDIDELKVVIEEYVYYYNNERGQWDRLHMTPIEYEAYLLSLSDEEFKLYMEQERLKYDQMKINAKEKAIAHAKTLGVEEDEINNDE